MKEIWKPIRRFESKYEVSNLGRVKSIGTYNTCKRGILEPMIDTSGYAHVRMYDSGRIEDVGVHRLVAEAFLPNPDNLGYVNHKDENPLNNQVDNLEWCSNSYNIAYSIGKRVMQYDRSGTLIKIFNCIADASRELGIPTTNISKCCKGKRKSAGKFIWKYE